MAKKQISAELRQFFAEELQENPNATLETALWHLRDLSDSGPDQPVVGILSSRLAETQELIERYEEHTPLEEFV